MLQRGLIVAVVVAASLSLLSVWPAQAAKFHPVSVQLLAVNDFHGALETRTAANGRTVGGAAVLSTYLTQWAHDAREADGTESLILGAGDLVGASPPISGLLQDEPTVDAFGAMGLRYSSVGNHEFDEGVEELLRLQYGGCHEVTGCFAGAKFQYLAANVVYKDSGEPILPPYAIEEVNGTRIGLIGVVLEDTANIVVPDAVTDVVFLDEAETVNRYVHELRARGIETIVVLLHEGGEGDRDGGEITGPIVPIVEAMDDAVDVVISGHTHTGFVGAIDGKLVTQAYVNGVAFADIDLVIDRDTGDVVSKHAQLVDTWADAFPGHTPDPRVQPIVDAAAREVGPLIDRVVGTAAIAITREQSAAGESVLGNLVADAQRTKMGTQIGLTNPGGIRADIAAGEVTWGDLFAVQPFGNDLVTMQLTGAQVERALEAQWLDQPMPRVLQVSGLTYSWSSDAPVGDRVHPADIFVDGVPLDLEASYSVVVNGFLADGGDNFSVFLEGADREQAPVEVEALVEYVEQLPQPFSRGIEGRITTQ